MLFFIYLFVFTIGCDGTSTDNVIREFKKIPNESDYKLNDTVTLSCEIQEIQTTSKNSILTVFRKGNNMYGEGCRAFNTMKYDMTCSETIRNNKKFVEYKFRIKNLEWTDRGKWECMYVQLKKYTVVEIKVPPKFEDLGIEPIKPVEPKLENTGPAYLVPDSSSSFLLKGRGSITNPYNLREGIALRITCFSSCSYPVAEHFWTYGNKTHGPIDIKDKKPKMRDICSSPTNQGMFSTQSEVVINCTALKMVGANRIVCRSESENATVHVLCPGGELQWELTTGEIVGIATSVGIIILLIFLLCLMIKRSRSAYHNPPDISANTYSSGVKV